MGSSEDINPVATLADYMEPKEACEMLGLRRSTIWRYIKQGVLKGRHFKGQGRRYFIRRSDIQAMLEIREQDVDTSSLKELLQGVKIRIHSVESRLDFIMQVLGLEISALRDKPIEMLLKIYTDAMVAASENPRFIRFEQARRWADVLCQFTELEFQRLVGPTQDIHPWKPIFNLCVNLLTDFRRRKRFGTDLSMQQTYRVLDKARKQLSQAALVFEHSMASNFGPIKSARIHKINGHADSLDRYIEAEVGLSDVSN
jgi:excisionase family DNA binding protein